MKPICKKWAVADGRIALGTVKFENGAFVVVGSFKSLCEATDGLARLGALGHIRHRR
jgi:hypothetical protein